MGLGVYPIQISSFPFAALRFFSRSQKDTVLHYKDNRILHPCLTARALQMIRGRKRCCWEISEWVSRVRLVPARVAPRLLPLLFQTPRRTEIRGQVRACVEGPFLTLARPRTADTRLASFHPATIRSPIRMTDPHPPLVATIPTTIAATPSASTASKRAFQSETAAAC